MNRGIRAETILLALLIALLGIGVWSEARTIKNMRKSGDVERHDQAARLAELNRTLVLHAAARAVAEAKLDATTAAGKKKDSQSKRVFVDTTRYPAFEALLLKMAERDLRRSYDGAVESANLPADKVARVKRLLLEQAASVQDAIAEAGNEGISAKSSEMSDAISQAVAGVGSEIRGIVGDESYGRLTNAMRVSDVKQQISKTIAIDMEDAGVALNPDQNSALAQIEADFSLGPRMTNGDPRSVQIAAMMKEPIDPDTGLRPMDQVQLDRAAQVLSPQQLLVLKQNLTDQLRMSALFQEAATQFDAGKQSK